MCIRDRDKEGLFDARDTLTIELPIATEVIRTLHVNGERMAEALDDGMLSTDLADYLVRKGVPFRQSHHLVGQVVRRAEELGVTLKELSIADYRAIHPDLDADLSRVLDFRYSVNARESEGGTATSSVLKQMERARELLKVRL